MNRFSLRSIPLTINSSQAHCNREYKEKVGGGLKGRGPCLVSQYPEFGPLTTTVTGSQSDQTKTGARPHPGAGLSTLQSRKRMSVRSYKRHTSTRQQGAHIQNFPWADYEG